MSRNPRMDAPMVIAFCLASVGAFFAAGWSLGGWLFDRLNGPR